MTKNDASSIINKLGTIEAVLKTYQAQLIEASQRIALIMQDYPSKIDLDKDAYFDLVNNFYHDKFAYAFLTFPAAYTEDLPQNIDIFQVEASKNFTGNFPVGFECNSFIANDYEGTLPEHFRCVDFYLGKKHFLSFPINMKINTFYAQENPYFNDTIQEGWMIQYLIVHRDFYTEDLPDGFEIDSSFDETINDENVIVYRNNNFVHDEYETEEPFDEEMELIKSADVMDNFDIIDEEDI